MKIAVLGGIVVLKDFRGQHKAGLDLVTTDTGAAVGGAELIVCPTPAFAQSDIYDQIELAKHRLERLGAFTTLLRGFGLVRPLVLR